LGQRLGQHFLIRTSILERIAREVCDEGEPLVIEIGPGKGALTQFLLPRAQRVVAIEVDPVLAQYVRQKFASGGKLEVIEADILKTDLRQWGPAVIAGNLPYYITSPILERALEGPFHRAVFLMQREVAERIMAAPGSRDYGYLSVRVQLLSKVEKVMHVPAGAFQPPPKVDSTVIRLTPVAPRIENADTFLKFAGLCFAMKRKNLRNNLQGTYPAIADMPEGKLRAEQLGIPQLLELWQRVSGAA
jgi:16S rRNA (adenine1518-N6/adenine1519-N6)-dimethyltransferase